VDEPLLGAGVGGPDPVEQGQRSGAGDAVPGRSRSVVLRHGEVRVSLGERRKTRATQHLASRVRGAGERKQPCLRA
jgi:hypothetical protein